MILYCKILFKPISLKHTLAVLFLNHIQSQMSKSLMSNTKSFIYQIQNHGVGME
jgi:hypothetical protein